MTISYQGERFTGGLKTANITPEGEPLVTMFDSILNGSDYFLALPPEAQQILGAGLVSVGRELIETYERKWNQPEANPLDTARKFQPRLEMLKEELGAAGIIDARVGRLLAGSLRTFSAMAQAGFTLVEDLKSYQKLRKRLP